MCTETYKDIQGYEGLYQISDKGNVMTMKTGRMLKPRVNTRGYHQVGLYKENIKKYYLIHRLVALTFLENTDSKEQVNHIDGVKSSNVIINLEWNTREENMRHSVDVLGNQYGPKGKFGVEHNRSKTVVQLSKEGVEIKRYGSTMEAQRETGVDRGSISSACTGRYKSAGGYRWKFA